MAALGQTGAAAAPALKGALCDKDRSVRLAAVDSLQKVGGPASVAALTEALESDDDTTKRAAAKALAAIGDKSALPALQDALAASRERLRQASKPSRTLRRLVRDLATAVAATARDAD